MNDPTTRPSTAGRRRWLLGAGALAAALTAALAAALAIRAWPGRTVPPPESDPFPLAALPSSPFRNTGPEAQYRRSAACRPCREGHFASFRRTGMGPSADLYRRRGDLERAAYHQQRAGP